MFTDRSIRANRKRSTRSSVIANANCALPRWTSATVVCGKTGHVLRSAGRLLADLARRKKADRRQVGGDDHVIYKFGQC